MVVAVAAVVRVDAGKEELEQGHALELLQVLCNCCRNSHVGFQDYIATQTNHEDKHDLIADIVSYVNQIERDLKTAVQGQSANDDVGVVKARNHLTLKRARCAFRLIEYLASGPHHRNQLAIVHTDILSVVNRVLAATTFKVKREGRPGEKHDVKIYQKGREDANIYHDLGERDEAVSPSRFGPSLPRQSNLVFGQF